MRRAVAVAFSVALAALLLGFFFWRTDWEGFRSALVHARLEELSAALVAVFASFWLRALRWGYLLAPMADVPFWTRLRTFLEGYTVTNVLPGRAGEVVRPYLLSLDAPKVPFAAALATVVVERVLDALTTGVMLVLYLVFSKTVDEASESLRQTLHLAAALGLLVVGAGFAFLWFTARSGKIPRVLAACGKALPSRFKERGRFFLEQFLVGLGALKDSRRIFPILLTSAAMWLAIGLYTWLCLLSVDIPVNFFSTFLFVPALAFGISFPTPGGIGGYHAIFQMVLLDVYGAEEGAATAGVLLSHAVSYLPLTLAGVLLLWKRGISWRTFARPAELSSPNNIS